MSNKLQLEESLSALMDNEIDDLELRRILKEMPEQGHLQHTWSRYHFISATLKQETHVRNSVDILSAVQLELQNDPVPSYGTSGDDSSKKTNAGWFGKLGQSAIAASVAMLVIYSASTITNTGSEINNLELAESTTQMSPVVTPPVFNGDYTVSEFSRFASFEGSTEDAVKDRLRQAVYHEFEEFPEPIAILVEFNSGKR